MPTSDTGNVTDGVLNINGSKIDINTTARSTETDSPLSINAIFNAWICSVVTDTVTYTPNSVKFVKAIETNALMVNTVVPSVTLKTVPNAYQNVPVNLAGTATDDLQISLLRVYTDSQLVVSNVLSENVAHITTTSSGSWSTC